MHQLRRLPAMLERRELLAGRLDKFFADRAGVSVQYRPQSAAEGRHGLHLYAVTLDPGSFRVSRNEMVAALRAENIGAAIHYEPVHRQPYYAQRLRVEDADFAVAAQIGSSIMSIPAQDSMTDQDMDDVLTALDRVLSFYEA
jgi:perosamine synthetase